MSRLALRLLAVTYVAVLTRLIYLANQGALPEWARQIHAQPFGDDLAHLLLALGLTAVLDLGLGSWRWIGVRVGPSLALLALTVEELSQHFMAERVLSSSDMLASWLGVALGLWLCTPQDDGQRSETGDESSLSSPTRTV
jgi:VanZ family protein